MTPHPASWRTRRAVRSLTGMVALIAGALIVAAVGPAAADRDRERDPAGDVWKNWSDDYFEGARNNETADIVLIRTRYENGRLRVVVDLRRVARQGELTAYIKTDQRRFLGELSWRRDHIELAMGAWFGDGKRCPDELGGSVDRSEDKVRFSVSRHCLGSPRWVRTGAEVLVWNEEGDFWFQDEARHRGLRDHLSDFGPRVHYS